LLRIHKFFFFRRPILRRKHKRHTSPHSVNCDETVGNISALYRRDKTRKTSNKINWLGVVVRLGVHIWRFPPDTANESNDITNSIMDGQLKDLLDLCYKFLPNFQSALDRLNDVFTTQLNTFHNQGTAFPPPAKLTATQPLQATNAFAATGNVHILILNNITGDVVNAINAGLTSTPASLNANSAMVLQAQTVGQGIAINERDSAVTVAGGQTRGFPIISASMIFSMSQVIPSNIQISQL
jgi:hypothetical protein